MSYKALYRRFRPTDFENVVGQDHIVQTLKNQVKKQQINHAYLFCGTRGTGKTSVAKIFAKAINCLTPVDGSPCSKCEVCKALAEQNNMDIVEIDAASNNRVDEIRDLREKVKYPPVNAKYKVYIIDEVHMLTESAFNALLKTLEEPPAHCVFILATTEPHKLPKTILSRCMRFDFRLIDNTTLEKLISRIYNECNIPYEMDAVKQIVKAGNGSARDSISIADTCASFIVDKLTLKDVLNILGENSFDTMSTLVQAIIDCNAGNALLKLNDIYKDGKNLSVLAKELTTYFRDLIAIEQNINLAEVLGIPNEYIATLKEQTAKLTYAQKVFALTTFADIEMNLKYAINPLLNIEVAILKVISQLSTPVVTRQDGGIGSPPSNAPNTKLEMPNLKQVWGKYLLDLSSKGEMFLYSACEDVKNVELVGDEIKISVTSLLAFNVLNNAENKAGILQFFSNYGIKNNITIIKIDENQFKEKTIADKLKEIIGEKLIIKGEK